jgi:hypothetical protein
MIGGLFFVINTWYHGAYPSMAVNVVWVVIALFALNRLGRAQREREQA